MKIIVLGAGLVGGPMAADLLKESNYEVSIADISLKALNKIKKQFPQINIIEQDLSNPTIVRELVSKYDMVINAVPGFMGFQTLKAIIEAGKNVVDIAFFPEDPFELDQLAREKGVIAIMDCGVAPGMSNVLSLYGCSLLDKPNNAVTYVGGLPEVREWPFEYKAVFSPVDVIEEYTRPARYVENGVMVTRPALSDPEYHFFNGIGTLESFNSDGLRSLAKTLDVPNMKEKTLRYPGHIQKMAVLREMGLFSQKEIEVKGVKVRPLDVTASLMFPMWEMKEGEVDVTVMKVFVEGQKDGKNVRISWDLLDKYCPETKVHSMARTTGYTATVAVRMIEKGVYTQKGMSVPEYIGKYPECVKFMLEGLAERNIHYKQTIEEI